MYLIYRELSRSALTVHPFPKCMFPMQHVIMYDMPMDTPGRINQFLMTPGSRCRVRL